MWRYFDIDLKKEISPEFWDLLLLPPPHTASPPQSRSVMDPFSGDLEVFFWGGGGGGVARETANKARPLGAGQRRGRPAVIRPQQPLRWERFILLAIGGFCSFKEAGEMRAQLQGDAEEDLTLWD